MGKLKLLNNKMRLLLICFFAMILVVSVSTFVLTYSESTTGTGLEDVSNLSGVYDNVLIVDDYVSDYNYYMSLNYTDSFDGVLPDGSDQGLYGDDNLVKVVVNYRGSSIDNSDIVGYVSLSERQDTYTYYKYYPVNDGYINIELIDNPFTDRPDDMGFNGWVTDYEGVMVSYDDYYYTRYARVPVSDVDGEFVPVEIDFYANWYKANVGYLTSSNNTWASGTANFLHKGFSQIGGTVAVYEDVTNYYVYGGTVDYRSNYPSGVYTSSGASVSSNSYGPGGGNNRCNTRGGCTYYLKVSENVYNPNETYYTISGSGNNRKMTVYEVKVTGYEESPCLEEGVLTAGFYKQVSISYGGSVLGYYDNAGIYQDSGTCSSYGGCTYYELIQYYDDDGNVNVSDGESIYYYFVTRDMNIMVMRTNMSSSWEFTFPFTLTSVHNGSDYSGSYTFNVSGIAVNCYNDTRIENIKISSNQSSSTLSPTGSAGSSRYFYGNYHNVKIGRGVLKSGSYKTFNGVFGGDNNTSAFGSRSDVTKYKLEVESGYYNTVTLTNGALNTNNNKYIEALGIYGSDYDRVLGVNSNLDVYYVLAGSWGNGYYYASSNAGITFDSIVKSGSFGSQKGTDHTVGIYIGGRSYGTHYTSRRIKIEGGWTYNLIGGPMTASNRSSINDTYLFMTGGEVDMIVGGAGTTATYGNRIISLSGGVVNYSVFGGSNGYTGSSSDGTINGSSFIYVGGNSVVGNSDYVNNGSTLWEASAGCVFGIGNGNSSSDSIGSNDNSYIVLDGDAVVNGNVYGGGNYGATGVSSSSNSSVTSILVNGGNVNGSIYGGGNNNGAGSSSKSASVSIVMNKGVVNGSIYGGSRLKGVVYGNVNVNVYGGSVNSSVYGGGEGGYKSSSNTGTFVVGNVDVNIGSVNGDNSLLKIKDSVYGGSAFGTVNGSSQSSSISSSNTKVSVNSGVVGDVYGGGEGNDTYTPYVLGNVNVLINGGQIDNVYGGNDLKGTPNGSVVVDIYGGVITNAYAGGYKTSVDSPYINLLGGVITNAFGGGNNALVNTSNVLLDGAMVTNVYGGSNSSGDVSASNVLCNSGTATSVFGGNNIGGTTNETNVIINGGDITNVFGGGEKTDVTGSSNVDLRSSVSNVFGGSDSMGDVSVSYVNVNNGSALNVYGGNNLGGTTDVSNVSISGGVISNVYGGGLEASTNSSNVNLIYGNVTNIFGGGSRAGVNDTHINLGAGDVTNVYGGSNSSGNVSVSNIKNVSSNISNDNIVITNGISVSNINSSGASDIVSSETISVNISNNTLVDFVEWDFYLFTSEAILDSNWSSASVLDMGNMFYVDEKSQYYGTNTIGSNGSYSFNFNIHSYVPYDEFKILNYVFVGYDSDGNSYKYVSYDGFSATSVYGGNNLGGITDVSNVSLSDGVIYNVYGGGNKAISNTSNVNISGGVIKKVVYGGGEYATVTGDTFVNVIDGSNILGDVYGGGNNGSVNGDTKVLIDNSNILSNVYGGGNNASIVGDTYVGLTNGSVNGNVFGGGNNGMVYKNATTEIVDSSILGSVYAGGNGSTAYVLGNNLVNVSGDSSIETHVFGGGNAALTGCSGDILDDNGEVLVACSNPNSSKSYVNIAGASIMGNVYGGANTSVVYGETFVNVGINTIKKDYNLKLGNIYIGGTIYGGGEANSDNSPDYDFSFISVTEGININIDALGHSSYNISGSIFGSGNASSSGGYSYVNISNYGTVDNYKSNVSIQRTDVVTLDNSAIELDGAKDNTNKYFDNYYSFSRVKLLKLKNGSVLFLNKPVNLLEDYSSLIDVDGEEVPLYIDIDNDMGNVDKSSINRIYMLAGVNLDISDDESLATFGDVVGMSFFGLFTKDRNGSVETAMYSYEYDDGDSVSSSQLYYFDSGSYVRGRHKTNHDYYKDGFFTNYANEEGSGIYVGYIDPTPSDAVYYRWLIGEESKEIVLPTTLTASKYSTLGTYELQLDQYYQPNTVIHILGVNFDGLSNDIELVSSSNIPRYASSLEDANTNFGLAIKTGTNGWITKGETEFLTVGDKDIVGTTTYKTENSTTIPNLMFYFYHSKNLTINKNLGTVTISLMVVTPIDDLNDKVERVNLVVPLATRLFEGDNYEGAMAPGANYEMFANSNVNITSKSSFSAYYSLYASKENTPYKEGSYRALTSSYAFLVNTSITMIDLASSDKPEYYYYVVNEEDYNRSVSELARDSEVSYKLSNFVRMGSSNSSNCYDDSEANLKYFDDSLSKVEEEFIFIVDFKNSDIDSDVMNKSLLLELRDSNNSAIIPTLDVSQSKLTYNLYANGDASIDATASLNRKSVYVGNSVNLSVITSFQQQVLEDVNVIDTNFYDKKLGIKLSLIDSSGNVVNGASLLGVNFVYDGVIYYPRVDGTARFNIAESIANVSSLITINTANSNLASGSYSILVETFGSSDGIYYGLTPSSSVSVDLEIINANYGLSVDLLDSDVLIDKDSGKSLDGNNSLDFTINYNSVISNPSIRLALFRRTYSDVYEYDYELVDLKNLIDTEFESTSNEFEYMLTDRPSSVFRAVIDTKDNLVTGTYKLEFRLYDNDSYVGSDYKYFIVQ